MASDNGNGNGDAARWRMVQVVGIVMGAALALMAPVVGVALYLSGMQKDAAVAMAELRGDVVNTISNRITELERRQDERFVSKEYFRAEMDRWYAVSRAEREGKPIDGTAGK